MNPNHSNRRRVVLYGLICLALLVMTLGAPTAALAVAPTNDDFDTATPLLTVPTTVTMSDTDFNQATLAWDDPAVSSCGLTQGLYTIWYTFTPLSYGQITVDTFGSSFDSVLAIWTGQRGNLQPVVCNDDAPTGGLQSEVKAILKPGVKYYIEVITYTAPEIPAKPTILEPTPLDVTTYLTLHVDFSQKDAVGAGKYDDKDSHWTYTGTWLNTSTRRAYSGSYKTSKVINNSALLYFDGNQFKVIYTRTGTAGDLDVWVDGVQVGTITQTGLTAYQQVYTSPTLTNGPHLLELKHLTKTVTLDAIEILAPPDTTPPAPILDLAASPSATYGGVLLSWSATGDDGSDGIASSYAVRYSVSPIVNESAWNAATAVTSGIPTPKMPGLSESMTVTGLGPGVTYYFAVRALDDPAPDSTPGGLSNSPFSASGFPPPPVGGGIHDDDELTKWLYSGTWTNVNATGAYGGSYRISTVVGDSAAMVFNGIMFTFTYGMNRYNGIVDVYLDGVKINSINQFSSRQKWQQKYVGPPLPLGQHTVQFIHMTGKKVEVDAIEIIAAPDTNPPGPVTNLSVASTLVYGNLTLTWNAPAEDSSPASGLPISAYEVRYAFSDITDEAAWDAAIPVTTGVPNPPKNPGQLETMAIANLAPGVEYFFAVRGVDEFENLGAIVTDSARPKSPTPVGAGTYDNKDTAHWIYKGFTQMNTSGAYNLSIHRSTVVGNSASFVFNGTGFTLVYAKASTYGSLDVYVDGVLIGTVNQNGSTAWQVTQTFNGLASGQHTVQFVHATSGTVNVDAITILP